MKNSSELIKDIKEKADNRHLKHKKKQRLIVQITSLAGIALIVCSAIILPNLIDNIADTPNSNDGQIIYNDKNNSTSDADSKPPEIDLIPNKSDTDQSHNGFDQIPWKNDGSTLTPNTDDEYVKPTTPEKNDNPDNLPYTPPGDPNISNIFTINKIINQVSLAKKYRDPKEHYSELWSKQQVIDYYKNDYTNLLVNSSFMPKDLLYAKNDVYTMTFHNGGDIVEDTVAFLYVDSIDKKNRNLTILVSRINTPYDCLYKLEGNNKCIINNTEVLIGGMSKNNNSDKYDFYFADFKYNDINYRIKANNLNEDEFRNIVNGFLNN